MKKKPKIFEPDPDIGQPCRICESIYRYRITMVCTKCKKKIVIECDSPAAAIEGERMAEHAVHAPCENAKMKVRRWNTHEHHHISYRHDLTVLLCYLCHQRLHGNAAITHHPFKKIYPKDIEPFHFAARVTALYASIIHEIMPDIEVAEDEGPPSSLELKLTKTTH